MYPKIQSQGLAGGPNTGSCAAYAYYLEHENNWKKENGQRKDVIPFYDWEGNVVSVGTVINTIDSNKKGLHTNDAKFYSLVINPSETEAARLGDTREEKLASIKKMVEKMMGRYASGFGKERIKSHKDLLYFYTIHEFREDENGNLKPGIHVHVIISRKDVTGQIKLSPMTNHRGGTDGIIRSGFNRDAFYRDCERIFDSDFGYQRRIRESYDYLNTMAHGSNADKSAMIRAAVKEEQVFEKVTAALARRASRLAKEAASEEAERQREEELARMSADRKKRNEFWNSYHSYYKPTLEALNKQCKDTLSLYRGLKVQGIVLASDIDEQYRRLQYLNTTIRQKQQEMFDAERHEDLIKSFTQLMVSVNPAAAMLIGLLLMIVTKAKYLEKKDDVRTLRLRANKICEGIESLKDEQGRLKFAQQDSLRQCIQIKGEKAALTRKLQELRKELESRKEAINLESLGKELVKRKETPKNTTVGQVLNAFGIYGSMMSAESKLGLELDLLISNTTIEPVYHPNGGVADLQIITNNEKTSASTLYSAEKLTAMLEKWGELTCQIPAHRIAEKPDTRKFLSTKKQPKKSNNNLKTKH